MIHFQRLIAARDAAASALRQLLIEQPTTIAKVTFAWRIAAGATLARAADVHWAEDGTLDVCARDAAWRREIVRARPVIVERMQQVLGPDVIRRVVVSVAAKE